MKHCSFNLITLIIAYFAIVQIASAQPITAPAVRTLTAGGARILSVEGSSAANPAFGFTGRLPFPTNLNDIGGGNGIFRPAANTMAFSTSSTERMRITSGGLIGIGTGNTTITQKLQLMGGNLLLDYASGTGGGSNLYLGGVTNSSQNGMRMSFYNSPTAGAFKNGYIDVHTNGGTPTDGLLFRLEDGVAGIGNTERMRIVAKTGNVGIGISDPLQKLHVASGIMISGLNPGGGPMLLFSDNVAASPAGRWGIEYVPNPNPNLAGMNFWVPWSGNNVSPGNHYLFLNDKGKISMGINPADICPNGALPGNYRLYVKDGILTEKVKVANYCSNNWADYVFAPDYQLKPLAEVESFIAQNKHLPGIPSASEIEKEGLDLADMLSKQMAKIEELTLHTIALNKRLEKLEAENAALKQKTNDE